MLRSTWDFGGKMHDRIDLRFCHHLGDKVRIGNITANETIVRPLFQIGQGYAYCPHRSADRD